MAPLMTPTPDQYAEAFAAIRDQLSPNHMLLLEHHYLRPAHAASASTLARLVGFKSFGGVNLQYGKVATLLAHEMGLTQDDLGIMLCLIVDFVKPEDADRADWLLVMRPNVARALEQLGWVPELSPYLFPHHAAAELGVELKD